MLLGGTGEEWWTIMRQPSAPRIKTLVATTGAATGIRCTYICGVPMVNDQAISFQNRFPILPDDIIMSNQVMGGRQVLTFRNTTGAAIVVFWRIDL